MLTMCEVEILFHQHKWNILEEDQVLLQPVAKYAMIFPYF